jgi:hypothetical protein
MALDWTRQELILALELYFASGADVTGKYPDAPSREAQALSDTLKRLSAYPLEQRPENYRSGAAVRRKLGNFLAAQGAAPGLPNGSRMDAVILWEFYNRRDELRAEADAIRAGIDSGALPAGQLDMTVSPVPIAAEVAIEHQHATSFKVNPSDVPRIAQRAEAQLVHAYRAHMGAKGVSVTRMKYEATGESAMYSDAWVKDRNLLIEAKSAQGRDALRQAIGQLYDYRRFHDPDPVLAVLLAYEPTGDRGALLRSASIGAIWPRPRGTGFRDTAGGAYV